MSYTQQDNTNKSYNRNKASKPMKPLDSYEKLALDYFEVKSVRDLRALDLFAKGIHFNDVLPIAVQLATEGNKTNTPNTEVCAVPVFLERKFDAKMRNNAVVWYYKVKRNNGGNVRHYNYTLGYNPTTIQLV